MNIQNTFLALGTIICLTGCGNRQENAGFDTPELIQADSIAVNEIIKPRDWSVYKDKVVVYSPNTENIFYVYSLPEFKFMYSQGKVGGGPTEFPNLINILDANSSSATSSTDIYIENPYNKKQITTYNVGSTAITQVGSIDNMNPQKKEFYSNYILSPELLVTRIIGLKSSYSHIHLRSVKDGMSLDSTALNDFIEIQTQEHGYSSQNFNRPYIHTNDKKIFVLYQLTPNIEIYNVNKDNKLELELALGDKIDDATIERLKSIKDSPKQKGTLKSYSTSKYIYALQVEVEIDLQTRRPNLLTSHILIYDWSGNKVKSLLLSNPATSLIVSADDSKIYTYNELSDFDKVYVYDPKL